MASPIEIVDSFYPWSVVALPAAVMVRNGQCLFELPIFKLMTDEERDTKK